METNNLLIYKQALVDAMTNLEDGDVIKYVELMLNEGYSTNSIMMCLNMGMSQVGIMFEHGDYFIADLIVSGMIYKEALQILMPHNLDIQHAFIGRVVIGVAEGDIHDIGKDIVVNILKAERFDVIDLGVDVHPDRYLAAIKMYKPDILLMSGVLSLTTDCFKKVIELLEKEGLRDKLKILIGGSVASSVLAKQVGADDWAYDPMKTMEFCKQVIDNRRDEK